MAKWANDTIMDTGLNTIKNNATTMLVCTSQPATRAAALAAAVASVAVVAGDFTLGDGVVSGRRLTVAAKSGLTASGTGSGTHIALIDGTNLWYVTTCTPAAIVTGDTVNIPAWDCEIRDPA